MPMYKKSLLILLILILAAGVGTWYGLHSEEETVTLNADEQTVPIKSAEITVYVTGAVNKPGVISLSEGSRVVDAVNHCGGLLPTADKEKVNMAQTLKDGQQVRVPEKAGTKGGSQEGRNDKGKNVKGSTGGENSMVNINTADEKELDSLPGVGPAMAKKIIEYRETEGNFQTIEDIKKIRGIGEAKFNKMKDRLCI